MANFACATASTSKPTTRAIADGPENEGFSDDSGVDISTQLKVPVIFDSCFSGSKRNKRKSSEPQRRKEVLQMKRFQWDTDEETSAEGDEAVSEDIIAEGDEAVSEDITAEGDGTVSEGERPSSGDSGLEIPLHKDKLPKQWGKPSPHQGIRDHITSEESPSSTLRQTVIQKRKEQRVLSMPTLVNLPVPSDSKSALANLVIPNGSLMVNSRHVTSIDDSSEYALDLEVTQPELNCQSPSEPIRSVDRPRNYKSMSRQRRIEANARERTRVHTISAAFESLRRAVPAYAHNQKLSKLAILRIASAYIVALACLNDQDYSQEQNKQPFADCVEQCTRTIQAEGKSRRRAKE